jgi:site-specific DNA recombinase
MRVKELDKLIDSEITLSTRHHTAEQLLLDLRSRLGNSEPPYEVKKDIVKSMVRKSGCKNRKSRGYRPQASISIYHTFSQVVNCTDTRASNNPTEDIIKCTSLQPSLPPSGDTPSERIRWARYKKKI